MWQLACTADDNLYRKAYGSIRNITPECRAWVSAAEWIEEHCGGHRLYVVHRLDQSTSGVLMFAKSHDIAANLSQQFREHHHCGGARKRYLAEVAGELNLHIIDNIDTDCSEYIRAIYPATENTENCIFTEIDCTTSSIKRENKKSFDDPILQVPIEEAQ